MALGGAFGTALALLLAALVAASTYSNDWYSDSYEGSYTCGTDVIAVAGNVQGHEIIRAGKGSRLSTFCDHNNYSFRETHTNLNTGASISIGGNGLFQETKATPLGGSIFMFNSVNAGPPFVVRDAAGNLILRDRGVIKETTIFDTLGDGVSGGIFIESVSFAFARPHPGLFFDTCSVLQ